MRIVPSMMWAISITALSGAMLLGCSDASRARDACERVCERIADCTSSSGLNDCLEGCEDMDGDKVSTDCADEAQKLAQCVEKESCIDTLSACASRLLVVTDLCGKDFSK